MKLLPGELLLTTREGSEADLVSELPGARVLGPALVAAPADATAAPSRLVFARQGFPVHAVVAAEPTAIATALAEAVKAAVAGAATAWTLQAWVADAEAANQLAGEMRRLAAAALQAAETTSPRFRLRHVDSAEQAHTMDGALAQLCMLSKTEVAVGATRTRDALSLIPGGRARQKAEAAAPSRAAMKLEEAFEWLGRGPEPGDLCVDLGAAPGGWCHVVLKRRARVIAVDPAQLSPTMKGKKGLSHVCASAFDYAPSEPVDWLLCDMAWRPLEVAQLLAKWAKRNWARQLVANIKLPMTKKLEILTRVRETLTEGGWQDVRARQLYHDRDEITLSAWRTA